MSAALQMVDLPPEAFALIQEGRPKPQVASAIFQTEASGAPEMRASIPFGEDELLEVEATKPLDTEGEEMKPAKQRTAREKAPEATEPTAVVSRSFRLPSHLPPILLRASTERRIQRIKPSSQEEIVAEALVQWLKKNGYLS